MTFLASFLAALAIVAQGEAPTLSLPEALTRAETRPAVVTARLAAGDAARAFERSQADPLALRPERVQARQRVELTQAELTQARYRAYAEIAQAYRQTLEAEAQLELAGVALDLAERALDIARIRAERGSATELDLREAETDRQDAVVNRDAAREGLELARSNLRGLTGLDPARLAPVPAALLPDLPPTDIAPAPDHPGWLQARHGLELAELNRELLDPSFASRVQIEQAGLQVQQAREGLRETERGLALQAESLVDAAITAAESRRIATQAAETGRERQALERQRLEAGLIAEIAYRQSVLATLQSELQAQQAEHRYLLALLDLQAGTLVALEGLDGF